MSEKPSNNNYSISVNNQLENNCSDVKPIPIIPFEQIFVNEDKNNILGEAKPDINDLSSRFEDSIQFIDVSPEELIHIKKVRKYKLIKHYMKGELLGQGVFAKVREFIHKNTLERFAAKIMKRGRIAKMGPNVEMNVRKEIALVGRLNHKNIIKMVDIHYTESKIYIFMEYCVGVLKELIDSSPLNRLPKTQSHDYFCQLVEGLEYLHRNGVFHRDIKPDNLLINNSNIIKIADFGVSKVLDTFSSNDIINGFEGTKYFQPPELLIKSLDGSYSGSKFDIWSSGVLLFKMVSGIYPFFNSESDDIWDVDSYNHLIYPNLIKNDKTLVDLFRKLFVNDFKERISIQEIKQHEWIVINHKRDEKYIQLPNKQFGDIYRGMSLLERIRTHFYKDEEQKDDKYIFCNQKDYEDSLKPKDSLIRSHRIQVSRSPQKRSKTPLQTLIRLGLYRRESQ